MPTISKYGTLLLFLISSIGGVQCERGFNKQYRRELPKDKNPDPVTPAPQSSSTPAPQSSTTSAAPEPSAPPSTAPSNSPTEWIRPDVAEIVFPNTRYTLWSGLSGAEEKLAKQLGYEEDTWNMPGSAEVELLSFYSLIDEGTDSNAYGLGFDDVNWDCYVNRYYDYWWSDIENEGIAHYWMDLGWTQKMWDEGSGVPDSEDKAWADLDGKESYAAYQLCYFEETWDGYALTDWL